jgi:hypothetical protein
MAVSKLVFISLSFLWGCGGSGGGGSDDTPSNPPTENPDAPTLANPTPAPSTVLPKGTTATTLSVVTDITAECRYAISANTTFETMTERFEVTGSTNHSSTINNLADGNTYNYYIRCQDDAGNTNSVDYIITFSVASQNGDENHPPVLDPIQDVRVTVGETVSFQPNATDPDNDPLNYQYTGWMTSESYTTQNDDVGTHQVTVTVDDGRGGSDSQNVNVTVTETNAGLDGQVIAYVSSSTTNRELRLIRPDGTQDTLLWQVPEETYPEDGIALGGLSWRPDGSELAFDSGHDWQRSLNIRDLYSISPNGQNLRRITRPPTPDNYDQYPQGTVTFVLSAMEHGDVQIYIEGMSEPYSYFAKIGEDWTFTLPMADLGDNQRQYMRIWDQDEFNATCHFSEEGWVDVIANTETDAGRIYFSIGGMSCPVLFAPSWVHDGSALNYIYQEPDSVYSDNNIWNIPHSPETGSVGERSLDFGSYVNRGKPYRIVTGPTPETANDIYFLETGSLSDYIYYMPANNPESHTHIDLGLCPLTSCHILDVEWVPDGSGLIFSRQEDSATEGYFGIIYYYDIATSQTTEILRLPGESIGNLSVSPDGNSIVFERATSLYSGVETVSFGDRLLCPCSLWLVDRDGSNLHMLREDGRQPAWSPNS